MSTTFQVRLAPNGTGTVKVGDLDLSGCTGGLQLTAAPREAPRLVVELVGDAIDLEGAGDITLVRRQDDFVAFLSGLDPEELEREALSRLGAFDDGNATQAILAVLMEWGKGL